MLASTKNDNEKVVSARGPTPPILKCYLLGVCQQCKIHFLTRPALVQFSRRRSRPSSGYSLFIIIVRWQHLPSRFKIWTYGKKINIWGHACNIGKLFGKPGTTTPIAVITLFFILS